MVHPIDAAARGGLDMKASVRGQGGQLIVEAVLIIVVMMAVTFSVGNYFKQQEVFKQSDYRTMAEFGRADCKMAYGALPPPPMFRIPTVTGGISLSPGNPPNDSQSTGPTHS